MFEDCFIGRVVLFHDVITPEILVKILRHLNLFQLFGTIPTSKTWVQCCRQAIRLSKPSVRFGNHSTEKLREYSGGIEFPKGYLGDLYHLYATKYRKEKAAWKDLFAGQRATNSHAVVINIEQEDEEEGKEELKEILKGLSVSQLSPCGVVPRGLNNSDNYCFLNVTLQSLLSCKEFAYFLSETKKAAISKADYPYLAKFTRFYKQFKAWNNQSKFGVAFTPTFFYDTINEFNPIATTWQEDAQEYLCFLLDKLSLEIRKAAPRTKSQSISENGEWMAKTGGKSRNAILLNDGEEFEPSHITDIFGGAFRSTVLKKGLQSSSRVEPFYCIHLDIRDSNISNLNAAMDKLTEKEKIEGYQDKGAEVQASKQLKIERTPNNLLLHLKRFDYDKNTFLPIKINKPLHYPKIFTLQPSWLSDPKKTAKYQLYCVISHLGVQTQGGHYTCDLYHDLQQEWIHFDDSRVSIIEDPETVLNNWNAYLLYYRKIE